MPKGYEQDSYKTYSDQQRFIEAEVRKYEELARVDPNGYRKKVIQFAALGYSFLALLLAIALGLAGLAIYVIFVWHTSGGAIQVVMAMGLIAYGLLRAVLTRWPRSNGREVKDSEAPELFALVHDLEATLGAPKIHRIILSDDFNAMAEQWPKYGVFGGFENTLVLGVPYLLAVRPDEARATIAHELGHFSGSHGRLASNIYRMAMALTRLQVEWRHRTFGILVNWFFLWYQPRFDALTFALRRQQEFEADAAATSMGLAEENARDLLRFAVVAAWLSERFWTQLWEGDPSPEPPIDIFVRMDRFLRQPIDRDFFVDHLTVELERKSGIEDTHPCLSERLVAMGKSTTNVEGFVDSLVLPADPSAAAKLFGASFSKLIEDAGKVWADDVRAQWASTLKKRSAVLGHLFDQPCFDDPVGQIRRSALMALYLGSSEAEQIAQSQRLLEALPTDPNALYFLATKAIQGRLPLSPMQIEDYLVRALETNPRWRYSILCQLLEFFEGRDEVNAKRWYDAMHEEAKALSELYDEAIGPCASDSWLALENEPSLWIDLVVAFQDAKSISAAFVAVRQSQRLPGRSVVVVVLTIEPVERKRFRLERPEGDHIAEVLASLNVPLGVCAVLAKGPNKHLEERVKSHPFVRIL